MTPQERMDRLYGLVPLIYRQRDEERGYPLQALLRVMAEQANAIEDNLDALYDDWFIETCREQMVSYIGELVGYAPSEEIGSTGASDAFEGRLRNKVITPRREVARAVAMRRRKGTLPVQEEVARDATGWPARAVEFRTLLGVTQNVRHVHVERGRTVDVRDVRALERLGGPFETAAHAVDVRNVGAAEAPGRYNIPSVGVFVWRLQGFTVTRCRVCRHERAGNPEDGCYSFNVLGVDAPLFTRASAELGEGPVRAPWDAPARLTRDEFRADPGRYYGEGKSFEIFLDGKRAARAIVPADLSQWAWPVPLAPTRGLKQPILVDPELGRFMILGLGRKDHSSVKATWRYGFAAAIGGGEYERVLVDPKGATFYRVSAASGELPSLSVALERWSLENPDRAVIELADSDECSEPVEITLRHGQQLVLRASAGSRPVLRIPDKRSDLRDALLVRAQKGSRFTLDGLVVTGRGVRVEGKLRRLEIRHCTLVPSRDAARGEAESHLTDASLQLDELAEDAKVTIAHSILGPIVVEDRGELLPVEVTDSVLDALDDKARAIWSGRAGPRVAAHVALTIKRCTVFGEVHAQAVDLAENSIFSGCLHVEARQRGCVRFCSLHCRDETPRRYHCQPDQAIEDAQAEGDTDAKREERARIEARVRPIWRSRRYGDPDYARLADECDPAVSRGADDESEMGVFHDLFTPQRMARLRDRLREFVPANAEVGVIPVT